ncbi:hypothetical protein ACHAP8_010854 [Fusarium lateritium]
MSFCCTPISHYWTQFMGSQGSCIDVGQFFVALAIVNLITNVVVLLIPVPEVLKLQMSREKKAGVFGILALGGFGYMVFFRTLNRYRVSVSSQLQVTATVLARQKQQEIKLYNTAGLGNGQ